VNIEAQYSLGRFRSRHYDINLAKLFLFEGRRVRGQRLPARRRGDGALQQRTPTQDRAPQL